MGILRLMGPDLKFKASGYTNSGSRPGGPSAGNDSEADTWSSRR